jgi:hypothetical protein
VTCVDLDSVNGKRCRKVIYGKTGGWRRRTLGRLLSIVFHPNGPLQGTSCYSTNVFSPLVSLEGGMNVVLTLIRGLFEGCMTRSRISRLGNAPRKALFPCARACFSPPTRERAIRLSVRWGTPATRITFANPLWGSCACDSGRDPSTTLYNLFKTPN